MRSDHLPRESLIKSSSLLAFRAYRAQGCDLKPCWRSGEKRQHRDLNALNVQIAGAYLDVKSSLEPRAEIIRT